MLSINGPVSTLLLACLLASAYAECSLCGQEAQEKKPAAVAPRLVAKEKFRANRDNPVRSLKFSPDGKLLAEIDVTEKITICDALTGQQTILFKGNPKWRSPLLGSVDFSPDGRRLLGCMLHERVVTAWDVESRRLLFRVSCGPALPMRVAFHPKGKQFAVMSAGGIQLRNADTGGLLNTLTPKIPKIPMELIFDIAFSTDGKQLAYATTPGRVIDGLEWVKGVVRKESTIKILDVESGKELKTLRGHEGTVNGISFSPGGKWIASASSDKTVRIWDTKTGETVRTMKFAAAVMKVAWSPDGTWLVVGGIGGKKNISIRDTATGDEILAIESSVSFLDDMALNAKGTLLAVAGLQAGLRDVQVWELSTPKAPPVQRDAPKSKKQQ
jgi:WD40 repeat protein